MKSSDDGLYTVPGDYVILMIQMLKLDIQIHHAITRGSILQSCYIIFAIIAHVDLAKLQCRESWDGDILAGFLKMIA